MNADNSSLAAARDYVRHRGWSVVPIPRGQKAPRISKWTAVRIGESDVSRYFARGENIGVLLGAPSGDLVDIDLDSDEAIICAPLLLPSTSLVHGRAGKPSSHRWYRCAHIRPRKFEDLDGTTLVEIRSTGQQTIMPPSVHPSGESIMWVHDKAPTLIAATALAAAVSRVAAAALIARHWPSEGSRHHAANALAGMLLREGWSEGDAETFLRAVVEAANDEESNSRLRDVKSTAIRIANDRPATGTKTLSEILGSQVVARVRQWLAFVELRALTLPTDNSENGWPMPTPLGEELRPVPSFDLALLPSSLRPLVEDISERMQTPLDYAAAAAIVALAGCVNRRALIIPKRQDTSWAVVPNLWGAIIAPPGMMKSPIFHAVTLPLTRIETRWRAQYERAVEDFDGERELAELEVQAWREQFKQAAKRKATPPSKPARSLREPTQRRLVLTDATFEKLHHILSQNAAGLLVLRDELTGWLSELGRQGREGERAFFLEAWNGNGGFTIDRIGRGSIHVPAACVSLLGNIQPARLRSYLSDAIEGGPTDDGLFQRFQVLVWPDVPRDWRLVDRPPQHAALETAERVCANLAELSADNPLRFTFDPEAQSHFFEWLQQLELKVRRDSSLAPALVSHFAKYRSLVPTLAGLFEIADREAENRLSAEPMLIAGAQADRAIRLCLYLEAHARRVYSCVLSPEVRAARELARHIANGDLPSPFTTRTAYLKGWAGLDRPDPARAALELLEDAGWVHPVERQPNATGGRPSESWLINPRALAKPTEPTERGFVGSEAS